MTFTIEVIDDNEFSAGWVAFVLGFPRDEPDRGEAWRLGWDTGNETSSVREVAYVFAKQRDLDRPQYVLDLLPRVSRAAADAMDERLG